MPLKAVTQVIKAKKHAVVPLMLFPVSEEPLYQEGKLTPAKRLYNLYAGILRREGQWVGSYLENKAIRASFSRVHRKLEQFRADGIAIDEVAYIMAHRRAYGLHLYPNQLHSKMSLAIYQTYLAEQAAKVVHLSPREIAAYDEAMITRLCTIRGETREEVVALLRTFDLL